MWQYGDLMSCAILKYKNVTDLITECFARIKINCHSCADWSRQTSEANPAVKKFQLNQKLVPCLRRDDDVRSYRKKWQARQRIGTIIRHAQPNGENPCTLKRLSKRQLM